ncbi:hypothetical protein [Paenibacillus naphthalenovorans]|uniref:hypothetical protein n=1 Tax=Paenibacillus naphthalenovorans TaxID=162209 RepID=UPI003D2A0A06
MALIIPNAAVATPSSSYEPQLDIAKTKKFRSEFGFSTNENYIKSIHNNPKYNERIERFGVSLSDEEYNDLINENKL